MTRKITFSIKENSENNSKVLCGFVLDWVNEVIFNDLEDDNKALSDLIKLYSNLLSKKIFTPNKEPYKEVLIKLMNEALIKLLLEKNPEMLAFLDQEIAKIDEPVAGYEKALKNPISLFKRFNPFKNPFTIFSSLCTTASRHADLPRNDCSSTL